MVAEETREGDEGVVRNFGVAKEEFFFAEVEDVYQ